MVVDRKTALHKAQQGQVKVLAFNLPPRPQGTPFIHKNATPLSFNNLKSTGALRPINSILPNVRNKQLTPNSFKNHKHNTLYKSVSLSTLI